MAKKQPATQCYARLHGDGLTVTQLSAVDLLAAGKNDTEAANELKLNRVTVTRWRLYSPTFQAALNVRRAEVWGSAADRLRALVPKAVGVLAEALESGELDLRYGAALDLLKLAGPLPALEAQPFDADEIVRSMVLQRREATRRNNDDQLDSYLRDLPPFEEHVNQVRTELEAIASAEICSSNRGDA